MGEVRKVRGRNEAPKITVIIPSLDGQRGGNVDYLLADLDRQGEQDIEVLLSIGFHPNGHARNQGVRVAQGRYVVCIDDDVRLGHDRVLEQLTQPFEQSVNIGMTGPAQLIPENSSRFQRRAAREISRSSCPIVTQITDSDFVSHMCLCIPTQLYKDVGWESDTMPRGTDPDLRRRVRAAGYRVAVVPDCWAYHPMPDKWTKLLRMAWRNGAGSAWVQRHAPEMCIDTPDGHVAEFVPRRSAPYRMARFLGCLSRRLISLQCIGASVDVAYGLG